MVIDSSALLAILKDEPERDALAVAIERDPVRLAGAPTILETSLVMLSRHGPNGVDELDLLLSKLGVTLVEWGERYLPLARDAFTRFGKGRHRAALNFGYCMSYAIARALNERLLFKGDDFPHTDVEPVPY